MAVTYCVPVSIFLFYRYENCFVFVSLGTDLLKFPAANYTVVQHG